MTADGELNIEDIKQTINDKTKIVAIAHISNVLGTINDVKTIAEIAHQHGAIISVDGAQAAPHMKLDMQEMNADFIVLVVIKCLDQQVLAYYLVNVSYYKNGTD